MSNFRNVGIYEQVVPTYQRKKDPGFLISVLIGKTCVLKKNFLRFLDHSNMSNFQIIGIYEQVVPTYQCKKDPGVFDFCVNWENLRFEKNFSQICGGFKYE